VLVLLIFFPLISLVFRPVIFKAAAAEIANLEDFGVFLVVFCSWTFLALGITTLFYFLVQLAMRGAALAIGELIPLAPGVLAVSGIGAFCVQCTVKTTAKSIEESVTRRLGHALKKSAWNAIRPDPQ
jgi:hypothetical protein